MIKFPKMTSSKLKTILGICLAVLAGAASGPLLGAPVRIELGGSVWSLRPFTTPIEDETEKVIEREILRFLEPILQYIPPPDIREDLNLGSSGECLSATLWIPLGANRLEAGLKCSLVRFRVPFVLTVEQSYSVLGYDLIRVKGTADGRVRFNTFMFGLLGRWTFLHAGRWSWSLTAGATAFPFEGDVAGRYELTASSPIGSKTISGSDQITIDELRQDHEDIPTVLIAPWISTAWEIKLSGRIGLVLEAALSQGSFLSAGLSIGL